MEREPWFPPPPPVDLANAPRYRGATAIADVNNTGVINGDRMNRGDWVLFTGSTVGIWQTARLMEWDGARWRLLPVESNRDRYMLALNDLTHDAPEGIFSAAFIRTLFFDMGTVNTFNILCRLIVGAAAANIEIDGNNRRIRSSNFVQGGNAGFNISYTGRIDANDIHTRNMQATNAAATNLTATNLTARGNVDIGNPAPAGGTVTFRGPRVVEANSPLRTRALSETVATFSHANPSAVFLWNWLNSQYSNAGIGSLTHPIIGTVHLFGATANISSLSRHTASEYRLFGIRSGVRVFIGVLSNGIVELRNSVTHALISNTTTGITVELVQI